MTDTTFSNIGCFTCVICYRMYTIVQSITIGSCSFKKVVSGRNGIVSVLNTGKYYDIDYNGGRMDVNVNGKLISGYAKSKNFTIKYSSFYDVKFSGSLLDVL